METTSHTIDDLIDVYSDLLHYVREDAEVHLAIEHDEDDDYCPTKLYARGQELYDNAKLWRLLRAAPRMLEYLQGFLDDARQMAEEPSVGLQWDWQLTARNIEHLIDQATGK